MKKRFYTLLILFIFTFIFTSKTFAADVWMGFDESWATTPSSRMYNIGNDNKASRCPVGKFVVGVSWYQGPTELEDESVHADCVSALESSTYYTDYRYQQVTEWIESRVYSDVEMDPSIDNPYYEYCVYEYDYDDSTGDNPTLNVINNILEFVGIKKTYAIDFPEGGSWLCYHKNIINQDTASESAPWTKNNSVYFSYVIPPLLPIYNYNAYNGNYNYAGINCPGPGYTGPGCNLIATMNDAINKYKNNDYLFPSSKGSGGGGTTSYYEAACPDGQVAVGLNMGGGMHENKHGALKPSTWDISTENYIRLYCRNIVGAKIKANSGSWWILPDGEASRCTTYFWPWKQDGCQTIDYASAGFGGEKRVFCPMDKVLVGIRFFNSPEIVDDEHIAIYCKALESLPPSGPDPNLPTSLIPSLLIR